MPTTDSLSLSPSPSPLSDHSRRATRPPSERDLEIYKRVKIKGREQWEVAQEYQLHYSRVSQIVKRVTRWLASGGEPADPLIRDYAARQRLAKASLKLRLSRAVEIASMALEFNLPVQTTRRRVQGITEVWREETTREIPSVNLGALRLLLEATQALQKLDDKQPDEQSEAPSDEDVIRLVFDLLCGLRTRAEASGRVERSSSIQALVAQSLAPILGSETTEILHIVPVLTRLTPQASFPITQQPLASPQVTFPAAQENLNLSAAHEEGIDANNACHAAYTQPTFQAPANPQPT